MFSSAEETRTLMKDALNDDMTLLSDMGTYTLLSLMYRSIASRINWPIIGKRISREFDIPKNILDLVYLQAILW